MTAQKRSRLSFGDVSPPPPRKKQTRNSPRETDDPLDLGNEKRPDQVGPEPLRIFSWNVNGIEPLIQRSVASFFGPPSAAAVSPIRGFLRRQRWPAVVCLQEVKIKSTDEATKRALESAVNPHAAHDDGPAYVVRFCLPKDKYNALGFNRKIYGVATIVREDSWSGVENCREVDWDLEGRILVLETRSKLAIFNIYAVNGTDNPYRDPKSGASAGTRHDRKLQFHKLLLEECLSMESRGLSLILAGDFNIARSALDAHPYLRTSSPHAHNRADFNEKFVNKGLSAIDTFRHVHGDLRKFTYHPRGRDWGAGCDRVDLILISKGLQESLLEADILDTPAERGPSDHVPLSIALHREQNTEDRDKKTNRI